MNKKIKQADDIYNIYLYKSQVGKFKSISSLLASLVPIALAYVIFSGKSRLTYPVISCILDQHI